MTKNPKIKYKPKETKEAKISPIFRHNEGTVIFSFQWFDSVNRWGETKESDFYDVADKLKSFELKEWKHLAGNMDRDHPIPFNRLIKKAQDIISKNSLFEDHEELWSFHFSGKNRLWGLKMDRYFMVIWWDPDHEICPSYKK